MRKVVAGIVAMTAACALAEPKIKVGYYIGRGGRGNWGLGWQNYLTHSPEIDLVWLEGDDVRAGRLDGLDVLVMPGGRSAWQAESLGEEGLERIRGSCGTAGATTAHARDARSRRTCRG